MLTGEGETHRIFADGHVPGFNLNNVPEGPFTTWPVIVIETGNHAGQTATVSGNIQ